jgi:hypothetical protein
MPITLSGCGDRGPTYVPVTGTVKFSDGTVPKGDINSITFQPASATPDSKAAYGSIKPDGSFDLTTIKPRDGARPGDYVVTVNIMKGYPAGKMLVSDRFVKADTSPLKATIEKGGDNRFDFVVEKP